MMSIYTKIVELTNGFSGAEMMAITNRAAIIALKRYVNGKSENIKDIKITQQDYLTLLIRLSLGKKEAP